MTDPHVMYGRYPVLEALRADETLEKIYLLQSPHPDESLRRIRKAAQDSGIPVVFAPREKLESLCRVREHQGVVAVKSAQEYASLAEILKAPRENAIILVLDHLEDPQNLGSLLRTSDAAGVCGVIIPKRRAAGLTSGAVKASAGASHHVPVARVPNIHQVLLEFRKEGFHLCGTDAQAARFYHEADYPRPLALVLGGEHKGLSPLLKNTCDELVKIPMEGHLDSLNVSVAGALILYEALRRRQS